MHPFITDMITNKTDNDIEPGMGNTITVNKNAAVGSVCTTYTPTMKWNRCRSTV